MIFFLGLLAAGGIGWLALPGLVVGRTMGATVSAHIEWQERQKEIERAVPEPPAEAQDLEEEAERGGL